MKLYHSDLHELLDQHKTFYKDLLEQQEKSFRSFVQHLEFSQAQLEDLKIGYKTSLDCHKSLSKDLDNMQSSLSNLSAKCDYFENQTSCNNLLFDGIPDSKTETWHESEIKVKN